MEIRILVVDDDTPMRNLVCDIVRKEGYIAIEAHDGQQALEKFYADQEIQLVILDVMMPVYDGWEVLRDIREGSDVPVMMLTALGDEHHEVVGLRHGADEYIAKPFSYKVFVARLNTLLRKVKKERGEELTLGGLTIRQSARQALVHLAEIELNHKEYNLLLYLALNAGRVLTREQILNHVWGYAFTGDERTIDTHIKTLRAKLDACGPYIKTIRGSGYMLQAGNG
ncbi:response regulator transcription factor [Paenibacillus athensensis]|uniref:DNA-binding response regulator n=1 Tax=Paenibacillus athensensis TaxID=1967502 RepID=A0A4Y8PYI6_9BACL|nr:response regulator transcription factor [Paenibacillus athensensis]MCD1261250.1 response regulator transcription factor [Paenibacillus athensensis]